MSRSSDDKLQTDNRPKIVYKLYIDHVTLDYFKKDTDFLEELFGRKLPDTIEIIRHTDPSEEAVREWVYTNKKKSKNKDEYVRVFKYICTLKSARNLPAIELARIVHDKFDTELSVRTLRNEISAFRASFQFIQSM